MVSVFIGQLLATRASCDFPVHQLLSFGRNIFQSLGDVGRDLAFIEALARLYPDPLHPAYDRLVGGVRRIDLQQFRCLGEEVLCRHPVDCRLWRSFHIDVRIDRDLGRLGRFTPLRQWRDRVASLDLVNGVVVGRSIRFRTSDDPNIRCRCIDPLRSGGELLTCPARGNDGKIGFRGSRRTPARRGEYRVERVEIGPNDIPEFRSRNCGTSVNMLAGRRPIVLPASTLVACSRVRYASTPIAAASPLARASSAATAGPLRYPPDKSRPTVRVMKCDCRTKPPNDPTAGFAAVLVCFN
ncbi:hypothetical protein FHX09_000958 [Rhizobium sp. BK538]|nr:hypothetical protein [Rhizobium sp. BK538]